jgi:hypothetical protein
MFECPDFYSVANMLSAKVSAPSASPLFLQLSVPVVNQDFFILGTSAANGAFSPLCLPGAAECPTDPLPGQVQAELADFGKSYASKSFWDAKQQRRVWFGWIGEEDTAFADRTWAGALTIPRMLTYDPSLQRVRAAPIPELTKLRNEEEAVRLKSPCNVSVNGSVTLTIQSSPVAEFIVHLRVHRTVFETMWAEVGLDVLVDAAGRSTFVGVSIDRSIVGPFNGMKWSGPPYTSTTGAGDSGRVPACSRHVQPACPTFLRSGSILPDQYTDAQRHEAYEFFCNQRMLAFLPEIAQQPRNVNTERARHEAQCAE